MCQAEIDQVGTALAIEHDVFRLDVAVDNPLLVRVTQRFGQGMHNFDRTAQIQRMAREAVFASVCPSMKADAMK